MKESNPGGSLAAPGQELGPALRAYRRMGAHWKRYEFARARCAGKDVLDLGCGYGYGAAILDGAPESYLGVDADLPAVEWAERVIAPRFPDARFCSPERLATLSPNARFDVVLSFEVIEHVADPRSFLAEVIGHLREGGVAYLSTPNGAVSSGDPRRYRSPFHVKEFTIGELVAEVERFPVEPRWMVERRWDGLDRIALAWGMAEQPRGARAPGWRARGFRWFARWFDGPGFWSIRATVPGRMNRPDYSTIFFELHKSS